MKFLFLPEGEDPDTYVRKHGKDAFERCSTSAVPLSRFLLDELTARVDLATAEGRAKCVHEAKPLLKQMQATALRLQLVRELAEKCRLSPEEVAQLCELGATAAARQQAAPARVARKPGDVARGTAAAAARVRARLARSAVRRSSGRCWMRPKCAPVVELIDAVQEQRRDLAGDAVRGDPGIAVSPALYQEVAARRLADAADDETAQDDLDGRVPQARAASAWKANSSG